ncbi:MAG TPA: PDZ domain-containing protein [Steroidobacteraceae bacterium]|nr:PDZ domain-containing protein [Steroidobacteraceae bacterium]
MKSSFCRNNVARHEAVKKSGIVLMLAASLAAGGIHAADKVDVERADPADKSSSESKKELNAELEEAQQRLDRAANEVAALSTQIASDVADSVAAAFQYGPRRTVIGVQLAPGVSKDGAKVQAVSPGGPAEQAGIRAGDVIVAVNSTVVKGDDSAREVVRLLRDVAPEGKVKVRVLRAGKPQDFEVVARPFDYRAFANRIDPPPGFGIDVAPFAGQIGPFNYSYGYRGEVAGLELTTLTPGLGRYFGTDKGVLVVRAPASDVFKLQDGDVILDIDGRVPTNSSHITRILRSYQPGESLNLRVMRDRKALNIQVTLPDDGRERRTRASRLDGHGEPL